MVTVLTERPKAVGFMGSDRFGELSPDDQRTVTFCPIVATAIRFALATTDEKAPGFTKKMKSREPMVVATTYPRALLKTMARLCGITSDEAPGVVEPLYFGGSLESKPENIERVDAIFDIVDTGATLRDNNLTIVADNLGSVVLGAVWRRDVALN